MKNNARIIGIIRRKGGELAVKSLAYTKFHMATRRITKTTMKRNNYFTNA